MRITDAQIRKMKPGDKPLSEEGLYVVVTKAGAKLFRQNYRRPGSRKQNTLAHGIYPSVTLARARELRDAAKRMLALGQDPAAVKHLEREKAFALSEEAATSFGAIADKWLATSPERGGPDLSVRARYAHAVRVHLKPAFGKTPIAEVTPKQVIDAVLPIATEDERHETARRVKIAASKVFAFGMTLGACATDPASIRIKFPKRRVRNHSHFTKEQDIGGLLRSIRAYQGLLPVTRFALELLLLTFVRPGEVCGARWPEFELEGEHPTWRIPADRMKMRVAHEVPLSTQAVALLRALRPLAANELLFSGLVRLTKALTTATLGLALRRMGYSPEAIVPHGFRGTASTWLNSRRASHGDVIEAQLAHVERSAVRAAYNHSDYMPERRALMQRWADELDRMAATTKETT